MSLIDRLFGPRQATVTTFDTVEDWRTRRGWGAETSIQAELRRYDEKGPGYVGWYGDITGRLVAMPPIKPVTRRGLAWITPDEPTYDQLLVIDTIGQLLDRYRSTGKDPEELVDAHGRAVSIVGECLLGEAINPDGTVWGRIVAQTPSLKESTEGIMWTGPDRVERVVHDLTRSYTENRPQDRPWEAYSPLFRALPEIERYRDVVHAQTRPVRSRMLTNGLVRFPSAKGDLKKLGEIKKVVSDMIDAAARDQREREYMPRGRPATADIPYPVMTDEKPDFIDMGRDVDPSTDWMETKALQAFARAVNMPIKLFVEGPGAAKFSNEDHQMVWYLTKELQPTIDTVWRDIWNAYLRPELEKIRRFAAANGSKAYAPLAALDLERWRVRADARDLIEQPDRSAQLATGFQLGINSRASAARANNGELMELPDGVTEYEHWQAVAGKVAEADVGATLTPTDPIQTLAPTRRPLARIAPKSAPAIAALPKLAAPSRDDEGTVLARTLLDIDRRAHREVADWLAAATSTARTRLEDLVRERYGMPAPWLREKPDVRTILRALPRESDLRAQLREADDEVVVAAVLATIVWPDLVNDAAATVDTGELQRAIDRAAADTAAVVDAGEPDRAAATTAASATVLTWLIRQSSAKSSLAVPVGTIPTILMAAGGAELDPVTGALATGADRSPLIAGRRWEGGTGLATGHRVATALRAEGYGLDWQWKHSYFGRPNDPFEPHLELDEQKRASTDPGLWGDLFPGDHGGCRCWIVPVIRPPGQEVAA